MIELTRYALIEAALGYENFVINYEVLILQKTSITPTIQEYYPLYRTSIDPIYSFKTVFNIFVELYYQDSVKEKPCRRCGVVIKNTEEHMFAGHFYRVAKSANNLSDLDIVPSTDDTHTGIIDVETNNSLCQTCLFKLKDDCLAFYKGQITYNQMAHLLKVTKFIQAFYEKRCCYYTPRVGGLK